MYTYTIITIFWTLKWPKLLFSNCVSAKIENVYIPFLSVLNISMNIIIHGQNWIEMQCIYINCSLFLSSKIAYDCCET